MKKAIIIAIAILAVAAGTMTLQALAGPNAIPKKQPQTTQKSNNAQEPQVDPFDPLHAESAPTAAIQAAESAQEAPKTVETYQQPSQPVAAPQPAADKPQGAHIPFTNEPVVAGDPESYIDTVGQCPFYEMAGPKGCVPPADIECNADWSVCKLKVLQ
jgi:hypothetical protein